MYTKESYFCKYPDGKAIWFAPNATIKDGYTEKQLRKMIYPEEGKCLKNKLTNEITFGKWIKDELDIPNWEDSEIPEDWTEATGNISAIPVAAN